MVLCGFTDESYFSYCVNGILLARNSRHLWYLIVLFEIFAASIFIKPTIQKKEYVYRYCDNVFAFVDGNVFL